MLRQASRERETVFLPQPPLVHVTRGEEWEHKEANFMH